jgi:predicted Fe-Mo cluster-binding NifX family protein
MKVAVPVWQGRVSPVFDVAGQLLVAELAEGTEVSRREYPLPSAEPEQRAGQLAELQVETLICGAISQALEALLSDSGIKVYGRICGNVDEVLKAFAAGTLGDAQYAMPGCCGQARRRFRGGCRQGRPQSHGRRSTEGKPDRVLGSRGKPPYSDKVNRGPEAERSEQDE